MRLALTLLLALTTVPCAAQPHVDVAKSLVADALKDDWGYAFLEGLTTEIGQRLAGTEAEARAAEWAAAKLKSAGFDEVHIESFPMTAWVRGVESGQIVAPAPQHLVLTALGGSVATPEAGIEAEIVLFRSYAVLAAAPPGSLAGKIAVVTQRMLRLEDGAGYGAANPIRRAGPSEAAKRGAVAYLHRSLGTTNHRVAHTGALNYTDEAPRIPAAALANPDADQLERLAARGPVKLRFTLTPTTIEGARSFTVVADIKGRERPDEVVLIGAHLDSWDLGTGAIDDGAGCAIVAAAGKLIAALPQRPRRTLRVVLFGAEEMNYSGPAYASAHADDVPKIVVANESDFGARPIRIVEVPQGAAASDFSRALIDVVTPLGVILGRNTARDAGDDVRPLARAGVPVLALRRSAPDYFDIHHTADDTLDKIVAAELAQNIAVWAAFAYLAADSAVDFRALAAQQR